MVSHLTVCLHPAFCGGCKQVVTINLKNEAAPCPNGCSGSPRPYFNSPELQRAPGAEQVSDWFGRVLNSGFYSCPGCGDYSLRFHPTGIYFD